MRRGSGAPAKSKSGPAVSIELADPVKKPSNASAAENTTLANCLRVAALLLAIHCAGCHSSPQPRRDINAVLSDHDDALMAIPGVLGVYVALDKDGKTPCLKVMVARKNRALVRRLPKSLEGYRVIVEETGIIRPLRGE